MRSHAMFLLIWGMLNVALIYPSQCLQDKIILLPDNMAASVALPEISEDKVEYAFTQAKAYHKDVVKLENLIGKAGLLDPYKFSPSARHLTQTSSSKYAQELDNLAERFEEATRFIAESANLSKEQISALADLNSTTYATMGVYHQLESYFKSSCVDSPYRTADGSCNNWNNPTWGKAGTCARRILGAAYHDGISEPRRSITGEGLPNPRSISSKAYVHLNRPSRKTTHLLMTFGQFLDHDLVLTPAARTDEDGMLDCCKDISSTHPACMPFMIPDDDPVHSDSNICCINFVRSACCPTGLIGPRTQINLLTVFVDASNVYGSSENETRSLRTLNGNGRLLTQKNDLLPPSADPETDQCSRPHEGLYCFRSGDGRLNQQSYLVTMHTIFMRQHNRVADELHILNPDWDDEKLFQEARQIVAAQMQKIVYGEYVPTVIGKDLTKHFDLQVQEKQYTKYNPKTDPSIISEFSTAAYRFGHSQIQSFFAEIYANGTTLGYHLRDIYFNPFRMYDGQMDPIIRGLTRQLSQAVDSYFAEDVTNHLYKSSHEKYGMDLPAINIQRGRDHGMRPYIDYLNICYGVRIQKFENLDRLMPKATRLKLESLYKDVKDIDLYAGGISEYNLPNAAVGPTFACIIGFQFRNIKFGDRYYFEHEGQKGSFNKAQLKELRKTSLARILCANSDNVKEMQALPFEAISEQNPLMPCEYLPDVDLTYWQEGATDDQTSPLPAMTPIIPLE